MKGLPALILALVVAVTLLACLPAFHKAAERGDLEAVRAFLDKGADVNELTGTYIFNTPLMWASLKGHAEVVKLLIDRGANVNLANGQITALGLAAQFGHEDVANILIMKGANIAVALEGVQQQKEQNINYQYGESHAGGIRMLNRLAKKQELASSSRRPTPKQAVANPSVGAKTVATGAAQQAVVAVFDIEAKGLELDAGTLDRLADWLGTLLTRQKYQVIPRSQLKQRLQKQKTESFKECYDESCKIEIGKELAAGKSLSTQVLKLGGRCKVSLTLYDLRRAASERAGKGEDACTEEGVVKALEAAVKDMVGRP